MITIARIRSEFPAKFGVPRQSGLVPELRASVVFEPEFRNPDMVRGLDGFSHLWLIWQFSGTVDQGWSPTVRPPRLGGETRMGVFATRSPFRPNPIGLSCVRLLEVDVRPELGPVLTVGGADLMDDTPILDIKPYVGADLHPDATAGFTATNPNYRVEVQIPDDVLERIPADRRGALLGVLAEDPRPAYQDDPNRVYGMGFAGLNVRFTVTGRVLSVVEVQQVG